MIYVVTLEDTRFWRNGIPPTVTLHANSFSAAQRVNTLMLAYEREFGARAAAQLWAPRVETKSIHYEISLNGEVIRVHTEARELQS